MCVLIEPRSTESFGVFPSHILFIFTLGEDECWIGKAESIHNKIYCQVSSTANCNKGDWQLHLLMCLYVTWQVVVSSGLNTDDAFCCSFCCLLECLHETPGSIYYWWPPWHFILTLGAMLLASETFKNVQHQNKVCFCEKLQAQGLILYSISSWIWQFLNL